MTRPNCGLPANGNKSEGPNNICFAPPGFPTGLNTGIFVGFHGSWSSAGTNNVENPLVYANPATGEALSLGRVSVKLSHIR